MSSFNQVILVGNLGADPEVRYQQNGDAVANFNIATTERWKDKNGEAQEKTEWHRIVAWKRLGEVCGEYLKKGSQVLIRGKIQTRKWTDKEGVERYTTEIVAAEMKMLGAKPESSERTRTPAPTSGGTSKPSNDKPAANKPAGKFDDMDDSIPF